MEEEVPEGNLFHVAWFEDGAIHVVDAWESEQHFKRFFNDRLRPVLKEQMKVPGEPRFTFHKAHAKLNREAAKARK